MRLLPMLTPRSAFEPTRSGVRPVIVEPHAVDDSAIRDEAEQARLRVSGLRDRGHGADLDMPETESVQTVDAHGILVEPGRDTERRVEGQSERLHAQRRIRLGEGPRHPRERRETEQPDDEHRRVMCCLRIHPREERAKQPRVHAYSSRSDARR